MNTVEQVLAERKITASIAVKPKREKTRPILAAIDNLHADRKLEKELQELDNYES